MAPLNLPPKLESRSTYWRRVLRPLLWWLLLVLVLYGVRLHQRHNALTNVRFTTEVPGQSPDIFALQASAKLDGREFYSGQQVNIGLHQLEISQPNAYPLTTNLFVWYGERNLGKIILARTKGTLTISASPAAERLTIRGREFNITLTNSTGFNSPVPTDRYLVEATYQYWTSSKEVTVSTDATSSHQFAPRLGTLAITASHPAISFELRKSDGTYVESGMLPTTIAGLPEGQGYQLHTRRKEDQQDTVVGVGNGVTNNLKVEFVYGVATIESEPVGASVLKDGKELGVTPLTLTEVNPGLFEFSLQLNEYEAAVGKLVISAQQTNTFRTNLISRHFTQAMTAARQYYENSDYDRAVQAANEALKYETGDGEAANLLHAATLMRHLAKAETLSARNEFTNAITEANLALAMAPDDERVKKLVADYTKLEQQRLEAVRRREAEQLAQQRTQELREGFNDANRPYENASQFSNHELTTSKSVKAAANAISSSLSNGQPAFGNVRLNWIYPHLFMLEARQRVGIGYRDCLILGSQVRENEVQIRFKVFEYEHPPDLKLLGGMLQLSTAVNITSQDPQVIADDARRFQQRIKDGVNSVTEIIKQATAQP